MNEHLKNSLVLIVDDERDLHECLKLFLEAHGIRVLTSADSVEALEILRSNPSIDMILADLTMPTINGRHLINCLRDEGFKKAVLVISGVLWLHEDQDYCLLGADGYLEKPFTMSELMQKMEEVFEKVKKVKGDKHPLESATI